jgi:hypothetical protein
MKSFIAFMLIATMVNVCYSSECANGRCGLRRPTNAVRERVVYSNNPHYQRTYTINKDTNRRSTYRTRTVVR